jgi:hypothetical protein
MAESISITLTLREFPDYGELMTREEFGSLVETGMFIDDDGTGYAATEDGYLQWLHVRPSAWSYINNRLPEELTHVLWFNR